MFRADVTHMIKMARAIATAASAMIRKVTLPATAPALLLPSGFSRLPEGLVVKGEFKVLRMLVQKYTIM